MPKHDFLSPKAIGNRIKSKGLQKLRWWCEMCSKQCRDENGFKCHQTSEGHLRQMRIFAENPGKVMHTYSSEFEQNFLEVLSRRHGTKRVHSNVVYQEYIQDKQHVHMNSTKWETLTNFILYLGKSGKAVVDETEKGWYLAWIDRDPAAMAKQAALERKRKHDVDDETRKEREIRARVADARASGLADDGGDAARPTALERDDDDARVSVAVTAPAASKKPLMRLGGVAGFALSEGGGGGSGDAGASGGAAGGGGKAMSNLERLMAQDRERKADEQRRALAPGGAAAAAARVDHWLCAGIVVKVMSKRLADGRYYKRKAVVEGVVDRYVAQLRTLPGGDDARGGDVLKVDQDELETVIPAVGAEVLLVNGRARGARAELLSLDLDAFCASVRLLSGEHAGATLERVEYEDMSKLAA